MEGAAARRTPLRPCPDAGSQIALRADVRSRVVAPSTQEVTEEASLVASRA
jgi:hypothetical protein